MEMVVDRLYKEKKIWGFCYFFIGQEVVVVGIEYVINKLDDVIIFYRCYGFVYMRGGIVCFIIGEFFGCCEGIVYGKGGFMYMFVKGFYGGNGIVGVQVFVGVGLVFVQKYIGGKKVIVILYGDGVFNQGQVFEVFNMVKFWKLFVFFGCESEFLDIVMNIGVIVNIVVFR